MKIDIVIYLCRDWKSDAPGNKGYFTESQFIRALAKMPNINILCINRPVTLVETTLKNWRKIVKYLKQSKLEKIDENLFIYTPFAVLHDQIAQYMPVIQILNRKILALQIRKCLNKIDLKSN